MTEYHIALGDEERALIELQSFNFFEATGKKMRVPPKLAFDLQTAGVSMKYIEPDPALEN